MARNVAVARATTRAVVTTAAVVGTAAAVAGASSRQATHAATQPTTTVIITGPSAPQPSSSGKQAQSSAQKEAKQQTKVIPAYESPQLPDLTRIAGDLGTLEELQAQDNVLAARVILPDFKRFYLAERQKYTDLQALHQTDIRLMVVENWLKRAHGLPEWPVPS